MVLVKLPKMTRAEVLKLIKEQMICRIAFRGDETPYIAPFQYVFINGYLYFHFTNYRRKMKLLKQDEPVCVEIEKTTPDMREYAFVSLVGKLKIVTAPKERAKVIEKMANEGKRKLSENFLASHGLRREDGWASLFPGKPLTIVKLERVLECIGLKSPS
jgi:hypothetical protein